MGRPLKRDAKYASLPGVGLPETLRVSFNRVCSVFMNSSAGASTSFVLNMLNPVEQPYLTSVSTPSAVMTNVSDPVDFTRFVNKFLYRKGAVYALTLKAKMRFTSSSSEETVFCGVLPGGFTAAGGTGYISGLPLNLTVLPVADLSEFVRSNQRFDYKELQPNTSDNNMTTFFKQINVAKELGIKKDLVYADQCCFEAGFDGSGNLIIVQPVDSQTTGSNANGSGKLWLILGEFATWYQGSTAAPTTPAAVGGGDVIMDLQITYHMLLFNDICNDLDIADPIQPEEENNEASEMEEWSEDNTRHLTFHLQRLGMDSKKQKQ